MRLEVAEGRLTTLAYSKTETFDIERRGGRRVWSPYRSKLAAYVAKTGDASVVPSGGNALYLGAGNGYTVSFVSDVLAGDGDVYCVEFSQECGRDLLRLAKTRPNVHPIIEDARSPGRYAPMLPRASWLLQDISQPDQAGIFASHLRYVQPGGTVLLSLKLECLAAGTSGERARRDVLDAVEGLAAFGSVVDLAPYEKNHLFFAGRRTREKD